MTDEHLEELLGAYALGAVDDGERTEVEALLARSPATRRELARLEHALGALTDAEATRMPPAGAYDRLLGTLRADAGLDAGPAPTALPLLRLPPPDGGERVVPAPPDAPIAPVVPLRRRWRQPVLAAAAAVVVAALAGTVVVQQRRLGQRNDASLGDLAQRALTTPGSRRGTLASADGAVQVRAVVDPAGTGYLFADQLPALTDGRVYQLWTVDGAAPVSLGILGGRPQVVTFPTGGSSQTRTLAITAEQAPGATAPTGTPLVVGELAG